MFSSVRILICISAFLATGVFSQLIQNPIYIIRNAETEPGSNNLSALGLTRASNCLPDVFGPNSLYDIGLVVSCKTNSDSSPCRATSQTATPVAASLNLDVDTTCNITQGAASEHCLKQRVLNFASDSSKGILLVWDENHFENLRDEFGLRNLPHDQPDAIFTLRNGIFVSQSSQKCPGIDTTPGGISSVDPVPQNIYPPPTTSDSIGQPSITGLSSSQVDAVMHNLYYTTTFKLPDPIPTATTMLLRRSRKCRGLSSKMSLSRRHLARESF